MVWLGSDMGKTQDMVIPETLIPGYADRLALKWLPQES